MSRIKTCAVTGDQLDDLMRALNLTRKDVPRVCRGVGTSAFGWWRHKGQIPYPHLHEFKLEMQRQLKLRRKTELDKKVEKFLELSFALANASGSAAPIGKDSAFHEPAEGKPTTVKEFLRLATHEELIREVQRRGGTVTFGPAKRR